MIIRLIAIAAFTTTVWSCSHTPQETAPLSFFEEIQPYCGKAFAGKLVSNDEVDASFAAEDIVMHIRDCPRAGALLGESEVRIPLHVGENRSRTWIVNAGWDLYTNPSWQLVLKHDHRHEDGEPDAITMYGGSQSYKQTEAGAYAFPADEFSKTMFDREGIPDSKQNTWVVELKPEENLFAYQMSRPNRFFRIEFDLSQPVDVPPPAWGYE